MPPTTSTTPAAWLLGGCLVVSGAAALIYEVLWLRQLGLVMGHTAYALSTVLTSFLGGLALGAYVGGRWAKRGLASPRLYAGIELAIAAVALMMPLLMAGLHPVFGVAYRGLADRFLAYNLVQFALAGLALVVPTFLMGTTLPIVTAVLVRRRAQVGAAAGLLYALNSLGGVLGAGVAGFVLLPRLGMLGTGRVAAALNVLAAAVAFGVARSAPAAAVGSTDTARASRADDEESGAAASAPDRSLPAAWPAPGARTLGLLYGVSGFAALALEVGWARLVGMSIGSTTYAFTTTLVTYISGVALGSLLLPRLSFLTRNPVRALVALHAVIALWTLVTLPYLGALPLRVIDLIGSKGLTFDRLLAGELVLVLLTIAVPTFAMGGMFPLVTQLLHRTVASSGYATGLAYASNTLGNIAGSWVAGFVLIPLIGMHGTVVLSAVLSGAVGVLYLLPNLRARPAWTLVRAGAVGAAVAFTAWRAPGWKREQLAFSPYVLVQNVAQQGVDRVKARFGKDGEIIDYREGPTGIVAVQRAGNILLLLQDGLDESGNQAHAIRLIGHLPLLFHPDAREVLVIGLGGGQTLRGVLSHPVERVDSIEISEDVRDVAEKYFAKDALADPRHRVIIGDARNHLRYSRKLFDVIVSQPSYPWMSGSSNLFTREYFEDMRAHLNPNGVACSWFFTFDEPSGKSIIRAWAEVFPNAYLLTGMGGMKILIGMKDPRPLDESAIARALAAPNAIRDLQAFGLKAPSDLLAMIAARDGELLQQSSDTPASTDDNAFVAFHALRGLYEPKPPAK